MKKSYILTIIAMVSCLVFIVIGSASAATYANLATISFLPNHETLFYGNNQQSQTTNLKDWHLAGKVRFNVNNPPVKANGNITLVAYESKYPITSSSRISDLDFSALLVIGSKSATLKTSPWPSATQYYAVCDKDPIVLRNGRYYAYSIYKSMPDSVVPSGKAQACIFKGYSEPGIVS